MPEHIRALIVILGLAALVFALARRPMTTNAIDPADFKRRRNLWFAVTLIAFLSHDFWVYIVASGALLLATVPRERNQMALFLALVFAVPPASAQIPGLGLLEQLFEINHPRLLALVILLPTAVRLRFDPLRRRFGSLWTDRLLLAYVAVTFGVHLTQTTFTNALRLGLFLPLLEIVLPYYVASRALSSIERFRDAAATLVVSGLVLSTIGVFENLKHWLLYYSQVQALGLEWGLGKYLAREVGGLRAQGSTGHPIALGFVLAVALVMAVYVRTLVPQTAPRSMGMALLVAGLVAALSRGPWIGAVAGLLTFVATGPGAGRAAATYAAIGLVSVSVLRTIPAAQDLFELIPFVGSVETYNVEYRQRLIDLAFDTIWQSPWFGGIDIYAVKGTAALRQGGGFIDVVNTYVGVLLGTGFVGLALFAGIFATAAVELITATRSWPGKDEFRLLGRTLLALLVVTAVTIGTTSSISYIPTIYWVLVGMAVGYASLSGRQQAASLQLSASRIPSRQAVPARTT
jgi:O-antigen ligase